MLKVDTTFDDKLKYLNLFYFLSFNQCHLTGVIQITFCFQLVQITCHSTELSPGLVFFFKSLLNSIVPCYVSMLIIDINSWSVFFSAVHKCLLLNNKKENKKIDL